jgi:ribosomal protein S18 acetylase RimI-like enzyme
VLGIARATHRHVELRVLRNNPAQRLYARLGFRIVGEDTDRLWMRAD